MCATSTVQRHYVNKSPVSVEVIPKVTPEFDKSTEFLYRVFKFKMSVIEAPKQSQSILIEATSARQREKKEDFGRPVMFNFGILTSSSSSSIPNVKATLLNLKMLSYLIVGSPILGRRVCMYMYKFTIQLLSISPCHPLSKLGPCSLSFKRVKRRYTACPLDLTCRPPLRRSHPACIGRLTPSLIICSALNMETANHLNISLVALIGCRSKASQNCCAQSVVFFRFLGGTLGE